MILAKNNFAVALSALTVFLAIFPFVFTSPYLLGVMVIIGITSIVVMGLGLLMGYAGQISLGHAAFYGLGAYVSAILSATYQVNPWLAIVIAAAATGILAYILGRPILKLQEHYLALATLGLGLIIHSVFVEESEITGGPSGMSLPYLKIAGIVLNNDFKFYFLVWGVALVVLVMAHNIINSRVGRALKSIHGSEFAAGSLGIDTARYKIQVFTLSAVLAGIAGSLYAHYVSFISPSPFDLMVSVQFLLMAVAGGLHSLWGPLVGVATITVLREVLRSLIPLFLPEAGGEYEIIVFGLILMVMMIFLPEGLTSLFKKIIRPTGLLSRERRVLHEHSGGP